MLISELWLTECDKKMHDDEHNCHNDDKMDCYDNDHDKHQERMRKHRSYYDDDDDDHINFHDSDDDDDMYHGYRRHYDNEHMRNKDHRRNCDHKDKRHKPKKNRRRYHDDY